MAVSGRRSAVKIQARRLLSLSIAAGYLFTGVEVIARAFVRAAQSASARGTPPAAAGDAGQWLPGRPAPKDLPGGGVQDQVSFPGRSATTSCPATTARPTCTWSLHSDGTSISPLEAMACGKPTLVSDIPGNREWVTPGENGWWFLDGGASKPWLRPFRSCCTASRLPGMGRAARCTAEQRADWEKNFPELLRAYRLAERKRSSNLAKVG